MLENLNRPKNHYEYNPFVQKFASTLHVLAGSNTYEYLRINLPGAIPTITSLQKYNKNTDIILNECQFQFLIQWQIFYIQLIPSLFFR